MTKIISLFALMFVFVASAGCKTTEMDDKTLGMAGTPIYSNHCEDGPLHRDCRRVTDLSAMPGVMGVGGYGYAGPGIAGAMPAVIWGPATAPPEPGAETTNAIGTPGAAPPAKQDAINAKLVQSVDDLTDCVHALESHKKCNKK